MLVPLHLGGQRLGRSAGVKRALALALTLGKGFSSLLAVQISQHGIASAHCKRQFFVSETSGPEQKIERFEPSVDSCCELSAVFHQHCAQNARAMPRSMAGGLIPRAIACGKRVRAAWQRCEPQTSAPCDAFASDAHLTTGLPR